MRNNSYGRRETELQRRRRFARKRPKVEPSNQGVDHFEILNTPSWFTNPDNDIDVSIIVPMFRSHSVIQQQIATWDLTDDGLSKEIIYVDDCCPHSSYKYIIPAWKLRQSSLKSPVGKIIRSEMNRGYGPACNLGAKFAKGKYFIFLNADTVVHKNWVRPLYDFTVSHSDAGIVGNLHLSVKNDQHVICSAGSEFNWHTGCFEHIGRSILNSQRLSRSFEFHTAPATLKQPAQRQMVTGCCFIIPRNIFFEIEGYDEMYRVGYWEDSNMNMDVQRRGYKVYYQPDSIINHSVGHSRSHNHPFAKDNKSRFYYRWVKSGFVDQITPIPRPENYQVPNPTTDIKDSIEGQVVGCVIACNEEEFLETSVRSIAPMVDRFIFVIGGNEYARMSNMCDEFGYPIDNTLSIAKSLAKELNGIVIEPPKRPWYGKTEMRNAYAQYLKPGDWMFMLDGDEVYKEGQLWVISELMKRHECLVMQYYTFWNNIETIGTGAWNSYPQERIVRWREGYHYKNPNHLAVSTNNGQLVQKSVPTYRGDERLFYHYSWVRPLAKIEQKIQYYCNQLAIEWPGTKGITQNYYKDVFLKWRDKPDAICGTHPRGSGGFAKFAGIHPYGVQRLLESGKLTWD